MDVRIIAATHRDLPGMVSRGEFRADLYYRLRVLPLHLPALRDRLEDIPLLTNAMLANILSRHQGRDLQISSEALDALSAYNWPGNVRELGNALEYAVVQTDGTTILARHLPPEVRDSYPTFSRTRTDTAPLHTTGIMQRHYRAPAQQNEQEILLQALKHAGGNKAAAAENLGMSRTTLWKKLKKYGIDTDVK